MERIQLTNGIVATIALDPQPPTTTMENSGGGFNSSGGGLIEFLGSRIESNQPTVEIDDDEDDEEDDIIEQQHNTMPIYYDQMQQQPQQQHLILPQPMGSTGSEGGGNQLMGLHHQQGLAHPDSVTNDFAWMKDKKIGRKNSHHCT